MANFYEQLMKEIATLQRRVERLELVEQPVLSTTAAQTIYIGTSGSDTTGDGSSGNPYASLYHVWTNVLPVIIRHEVTIQFQDGTYTLVQDQNLAPKFGSATVSILGNAANKNLVILDGANTYYGPYFDGVRMGTLYIRYITVKRSTQAGISANGTSKLLVFDNVLIENQLRGLQVLYQSTVDARNNDISNNTNEGIGAYYGGDVFSVNNVSSTTYTATANNSTYGLRGSNHGEITKSGTQPSGATAAEFTSGGGSIA